MHTHPESTGAKFGTLEQTSVYGPVSVCLTQIDVLLRQLNKGSHKQYHAIAQWFSFSDAKDYSEIPPGLTPTGAPNAGGWVKIGDFRQITHYISKTVQGRHTHTHSFNGPFSGTTQVSWYQKGKTNLDFTGARDSEWQWHQPCHMQVCTLLQTNTTPAPHHSVFYRPDALPAAQPTASKHWRHTQTHSFC